MKPTLPEPELVRHKRPMFDSAGNLCGETGWRVGTIGARGINQHLYTAKTVQRLIDEAYAAGLEDAEKACDEISIEAAKQWKERYRPFDQGREHGADECAEAIRALKDGS